MLPMHDAQIAFYKVVWMCTEYACVALQVAIAELVWLSEAEWRRVADIAKGN
jgi:hypothetical protein